MANELYVSQLYKYQVHAKLSAGLGNFYYEDYEFDTVYFDKDIIIRYSLLGLMGILWSQNTTAEMLP